MNWYKIYSTKNYMEATILKGKLEENSIEAIVLNLQDTSYPVFGDIEVYVPQHLKHLAINLLNNTLSN